MTLTRKTTLAVGGTLLALVVCVFALVSWLLISGFATVERGIMRRNYERASDAVRFAGETLSTKLSDWAAWDDSYRFVNERGDEFRRANLLAKSLHNLGLACIAFVNTAGELVEAPYVQGPEAEHAQPLPADLAALLTSRDPLLQHDSLESAKHGLLALSSGTYLIASRPILNSQGEGPARGTLVFVSRADGEWMRTVSKRLRMDIAVLPLEAAQVRGLPVALDADGIVIRSENTANIEAAGILEDARGDPGFVVTVTLPRFVFQQAMATSRHVLIGLVSVGAMGTIVTLLALRGLVLRRVSKLHDAIEQIARTGDLQTRLPDRTRDELGGLSREINTLLASLGRARADLEAQARELDLARRAAESASHAKSTFLANMSHEIRTPMTAILGFADILAEPDQAGDIRADAIATIRRNGDHLLTIINDILDLSKIEAGKMSCERIAFPSLRPAEEAITLLRDRAVAKGLELRLETTGTLPPAVMGDPTRLKQILVNLVGNAIKFTHAGSIVVMATFDTETRRLRFAVRDTGIGLDADQLAHLFQPFTQGDSSTRRRFGGTGLGLAISRTLARLLGGDLVVESAPRQGSTFTVTVAAGDEFAALPAPAPRPFASASGPTSTSPAPAASAGCLRGRRVLFAEDGPDNQRLIGLHLRRAGAEVTLAGNGRLALDAYTAANLAGTPFDLILLDMQMPELDGYGAARELREKGAPQPIIALTAHAMAGDRERCIQAGCSDYLTKPVDRARLIEACEWWLRAEPACVLPARPERRAA